MAIELKSFYRTVGENEGSKCHYPTRLDMYGRGCGHDCNYCYAKSQLARRYNWNPIDPAVADIEKIRVLVQKIPTGTIVRLGGLTDCFQPIELIHKTTYETIKILNERRIGYLIVTKSALVADDEYMAIMDRELAHIQVSITSTDDKVCATYEKASAPSLRIKAIEKLAAAGFDVAVRLSPLIPGYYDPAIINAIKCDKLLVEFLRNDAWIKKWFNIDWTPWSIKESTYGHLTLEHKKQLLSELTGFKEISVCEDCSEHYEYWKNHFNPNPDDCCNLTISSETLAQNEKARLELINARAQEKRVHLNKAKRIRVTFDTGEVFECPRVQRTYFEVINHIGGDKVRALGIMRAGSNIVSPDLSTFKEIYQKEHAKSILSNGMYLFFHMSTEAKVNILIDINKATGNHYKIEYIES